MVAEITLYWIIYESCSKDSMDLPKTQAELHSWKQEWKFLFGKYFDFPKAPFLTVIEQTNLDLSSSRWAFILPNYLSSTNP